MGNYTTDIKYCPSCGNKLTDQPTFCPKCGTNLNAQQNIISNNETVNKTSRIGKYVALLGISLSLISVSSCAGGLFNSNKELYDASFWTSIIGFILLLLGFTISMFERN